MDAERPDAQIAEHPIVNWVKDQHVSHPKNSKYRLVREESIAGGVIYVVRFLGENGRDEYANYVWEKDRKKTKIDSITDLVFEIHKALRWQLTPDSIRLLGVLAVIMFLVLLLGFLAVTGRMVVPVEALVGLIGAALGYLVGKKTE